MKTFLFIACLLAAGLLPEGQDYVRHQEQVVVFIATAFIARLVFKKFGIFAALFYSWVCIRAVIFFASPDSPVAAQGRDVEIAFDSLTSRAFLLTNIVTLWLCLFPYRAIIPALKAVLAVETLGVILRGLFGRGPWYMLDVGSLDGVLIAMLYGACCLRPELLSWKLDTRKRMSGNIYSFWIDFCFVTLPIIAVFMTKSSVGIGVLLAIISLVAAFNKNVRLPVAVFVMSLVVFAAYYLGGQLFDQSGRFESWTMALDWFERNVHQWKGAGTGVYWAQSDLIATNWIFHHGGHGNKHVFNMMHNDFLQVMFENGYYGLSLMLCTWVQAIYRSIQKPWLFASICSLGIVCFFDSFLRMPFAAMCLGLLMALALHKKNIPVRIET